MGSRATGSTVVTVNSFSTGVQILPSAALLPDGGWVVAYMSSGYDGSSYGVAFQRYDAFGFPVGAETSVNEFADDYQGTPVVAALADGGWLVTWSSVGQIDSSYDVFQRRFDSDGNPVGGETLVNTETDNSQFGQTVIGLSDGGWVVLWESASQDGSFDGVYQQRYDADGVPFGAEQRVNTTTLDPQDNVEATALTDGGWLVTWESTTQDGSGVGIYQQRYDAAGQPSGGETLVNTTTAESQFQNETTALGDGGWIVVWTSNLQDGDGSGIYFQRFDADGGRIGVETRANTTTALNQTNAQIARLADGGWIIVWENHTMGGSRLMQQRYDADGHPVGGETLVHDESGTNQSDATIVATPDGGWTISWTRDELSLDGDTQVVQRHFAPDIVGTSGDDQLAGGFWGEAIFGLQGNDIIFGNGGDDVMVGGLGDDTYLVNAAGDDIREFNGEGYDIVTALVSYSIAGDAVEELRLSGTADLNGYGNAMANFIHGNTGANLLYGNGGNDAIDGNFGDDQLFGGAGNDNLTGGAGNDRLVGGAGRDTAFYAGATAGITINLGLTNSQDTGGAGVDTVIDVEDIVGSAFNDALTGTDGDNVIEGGAGNDVLSGLLGIDTVSYSSAGGGITVRLAQVGAQNTRAGGSDTLSGFENAIGSAFNDVLVGDNFDNVLDGGAGNDTVDGNNGIDTANYGSAISRVTVDLSLAGPQNTLGAGSDSLISIENLIGSAFGDTLLGSSVANQLSGGAGIDVLGGGAGADRLIGGTGRDVLTGGGGGDRFIFNDGDSGRTALTMDRIADFSQAGGDRIALNQIDADTALAGDQAFTFIGGAAFSGAAGELRITNDGTNSFVHGDTNGDGFADFSIFLDGLVPLVAGDFIL